MPMTSHATRAVVLSLAAVAACGGDSSAPGPRTADQLELASPPPSLVAAGWDTVSVTVRARDASGGGVSGTAVTWSVIEGGGSVEPLSAATDDEGRVTARWLVGAATGRQRLRVAVAGGSAETIVETSATALTADAVDAGATTGCALRGGETWCFGDINSLVPLGSPALAAPRPARFFPGVTATSVAVANTAACIADAAGGVHCLGGRYRAEVPTGAPLGTGWRLPNLPPLRDLSSGDEYFCGVAVADSTAWCWINSSSYTQWQVSADLRFRTVRAGGQGGTRHACGLTADSTTYCWGLAALGDPDAAGEGPVQPVGLPKAAALDAGNGYACALDAQGAVWCWGERSPLDLQATPRIDAPSAARVFTGARTRVIKTGGGAVSAAGVITDADLSVLGSLGVRDLSADDAICALTEDRLVYCSGAISTSTAFAFGDPASYPLRAVAPIVP